MRDDALVKLAWEIARALDESATLCGADDDQVSATAKLPALVARYAGQPELPAYVDHRALRARFSVRCIDQN